MSIMLSPQSSDPTTERIERRKYGEKEILLHVVGEDRIVWIEVVSPNGDVAEIDPNYVDVDVYKALLAQDK